MFGNWGHLLSWPKCYLRLLVCGWRTFQWEVPLSQWETDCLHCCSTMSLVPLFCIGPMDGVQFQKQGGPREPWLSKSVSGGSTPSWEPKGLPRGGGMAISHLVVLKAGYTTPAILGSALGRRWPKGHVPPPRPPPRGCLNCGSRGVDGRTRRKDEHHLRVSVHSHA